MGLNHTTVGSDGTIWLAERSSFCYLWLFHNNTYDSTESQPLTTHLVKFWTEYGKIKLQTCCFPRQTFWMSALKGCEMLYRLAGTKPFLYQILTKPSWTRGFYKGGGCSLQEKWRRLTWKVTLQSKTSHFYTLAEKNAPKLITKIIQILTSHVRRTWVRLVAEGPF